MRMYFIRRFTLLLEFSLVRVGVKQHHFNFARSSTPRHHLLTKLLCIIHVIETQHENVRTKIIILPIMTFFMKFSRFIYSYLDITHTKKSLVFSHFMCRAIIKIIIYIQTQCVWGKKGRWRQIFACKYTSNDERWWWKK